MTKNRYPGIALLAIAGLTSAPPALAQTPDARAGSVVVETQKPVPRAAARPADGIDRAIVIVGGRGRHGAKSTRKPSGGTTGAARTTTRP